MPTSAFSKGRPAAAAVLPAGACDCHLRVYDSRYPPMAGAALPPPAACIDDYRQVQRRKLRAVATPSAKRLKSLPRVPTMPEAGQKGFVIEQLQAVFLPALTPATDVQRLNADINQALQDPAVMQLADKLGVRLVGGTPEYLAQVQKADCATWAQVIRNGHIQAN